MAKNTIPKQELLTRDESIQLIDAAKLGDGQALQTYYDRNRGLFENLLNKYKRCVPDVEWDDMRQEAFLGLVRGIEHYVESKSDARPEGYVFFWVRAALSQYIKTYRRRRNLHVSLDREIYSHGDSGDSSGMELIDNLIDASPGADDMLASDVTLRAAASACLEFPDRERQIVERRILSDDPDTLNTIGNDIGVSRERVRQLELKAKHRLRLALGQL